MLVTLAKLDLKAQGNSRSISPVKASCSNSSHILLKKKRAATAPNQLRQPQLKKSRGDCEVKIANRKSTNDSAYTYWLCLVTPLKMSGNFGEALFFQKYP